MPPTSTYRLTPAGKRLWRLYTGFTLAELDEQAFIHRIQSDAVPIGGRCLSCGEEYKWIVEGLFCIGCTAATCVAKSV